MADDEKRDDGQQRPLADAAPGSATPPGAAQAPPGRTPNEDEDGEPRQPITLDRYWASRKRQSHVSWIHLIALAFMLGALVVLMMFKDQCGRSVSNILFMVSPDSGAPPPAKIQLDPPRTPPASRPTPGSQPAR